MDRAFLGGEAAFNPALIAVQKRATAFTGLPWTHSECLQLVSYHAGQHFALHTDYFDEVSAVTFCASCLGRASERRPLFLCLQGDEGTDLAAGQRVFTGLIYLNDDFEGGTTDFPALNRSFAPRKGSMVLWRNVDHAMVPVRANAHCRCGSVAP